MNKVFSNLEAKISSITVRLLTKEIRPEKAEEDIPTLLLRLNNLEYKKRQGASLDPGVPTSDIQAILDGKVIDLQEASLHLLKSTFLYTDEFLRGGRKCDEVIHRTLLKMKFPQDYPLNSHPSTLILMKSTKALSSLPAKAFEVAFNFSLGSDQVNHLKIGFALPNIEAILEFKQLK